jgi:predicted nucleic acid-binding protein
MSFRSLFPVWPLVLDTNVLRQEVLRRVRLPERPTRMATALGMNTIRLLTAPHVVEEMDEHIREFAQKDSLDPEEAWRIWRDEYLPELFVVDVAGLLRDHALVQRVSDPDDTPLGVLAALLGVRALSADRADLGALASGDEWLQHIIAATDAGLGEVVLHGTGLTIYGLIKGLYSGASRVYKYVAETCGRDFANLAACVAGAVVVLVLLHEPSRTRLLESGVVQWSKSAGRDWMGTLAYTSVKGQQGRDYLSTVALTEDNTATEMHVARVLAASRFPLPAEDVARLTSTSLGEVSTVLQRFPAFVALPFDEWQLGSNVPATTDASTGLRSRAVAPPWQVSGTPQPRTVPNNAMPWSSMWPPSGRDI